MKQPFLLVLTVWPSVGNEHCYSTLPGFLMISQTFVIVQAAYFIVNNSMLLRIFQGLSCQYLKGDLSQNVDSD